jgi:hypothetical protein
VDAGTADLGGADLASADALRLDAVPDAGTGDPAVPVHMPTTILTGTSVGTMTSSAHRLRLGVGAQRPAGRMTSEGHALTLQPLR